MEFLSFLVLVGIAYLVWRISDQLPDLIFRVSEIQRDLAELRRRQTDGGAATSRPTESGGGRTSEDKPA